MRYTTTRMFLLLVGLCLAGCGSVQIPEQRFYRLQPAQIERPATAPEIGVLRVDSLQLGSGLSADQLLVAGQSPVELRTYGLHRWASPLDRLVADCLRTSLTRTGVFQDVKGTLEEGGEQLVLTGRILDFHQVAEGDRWVVRTTLELRGYSPQLGRPVFQEEFSHSEELADGKPSTAVLGLSKALDEVANKVVARCRDWAHSDIGVHARPAAPGK